MASGVCAPLRAMSAGAISASRQPVQMRSSWRTAPSPSLPALTAMP